MRGKKFHGASIIVVFLVQSLIPVAGLDGTASEDRRRGCGKVEREIVSAIVYNANIAKFLFRSQAANYIVQNGGSRVFIFGHCDG